MENNPSQMHTGGDMMPPSQKPGKGAVIALVIVIILAIAAIGGTWYYMNNKAKNDKKAQETQIEQLQKQTDELSQAVKNADVASILSQVKSAYSYWLAGATPSSQTTYDTMKSAGYITQAVVDNSKLPYDLLTCSQSVLPYKSYVFKDPSIQTSTSATMNVEAPYPTSTTVIKLNLVKDGGIWKINSVTCPAQ